MKPKVVSLAVSLILGFCAGFGSCWLFTDKQGGFFWELFLPFLLGVLSSVFAYFVIQHIERLMCGPQHFTSATVDGGYKFYGYVKHTPATKRAVSSLQTHAVSAQTTSTSQSGTHDDSGEDSVT